MKKDLYALRHTLNEIFVSGEGNLDRLLACIQTVNRMIDDMNREESHADDQTD